MSVALVPQQATYVCHIVICRLSARKIFFQVIAKKEWFTKKNIEHFFLFSVQVLPEKTHSKKK